MSIPASKMRPIPFLVLLAVVWLPLAACSGPAPTQTATEVPTVQVSTADTEPAATAAPAREQTVTPSPTREQVATAPLVASPAATPVAPAASDPTPAPSLPQEPTATPEPKTAADLSPRDVSGVSLAPPLPVAGTTGYDYEPPTLEELLEQGLYGQGGTPVDIVLRGVLVPGSVRCEWQGVARTAQQREQQIRYWLAVADDATLPAPAELESYLGAYLNSLPQPNREYMRAWTDTLARGGLSTKQLALYCHVDYTVSEYLLGSGPTTVTLTYDQRHNEVSWEVMERMLAVAEYEDEEEITRVAWEQFYHEEPSSSAKEVIEETISQRDNVMFILPSAMIDNVSVESWTVIAQWDLQIVGGVLTAVRYGIPSDDDEYSQTFDNLKSRVTTGAATDEFTGKRIATIAGITQHYRDLGAYGDISPADDSTAKFTPNKPPPVQVCGDATALERDCGTLLGVKDELAGMASLNWSATLAMSLWTGITTGGSPTRVTAISLPDSNLNGSVPGGLSHLQSLSTLDLSGNQLTGSIPGQLANLPALATLKLSGNSLTGCIPGGLRDVATHDLASLSLNYCDATAPGAEAGRVQDEAS